MSTNRLRFPARTVSAAPGAAGHGDEQAVLAAARRGDRRALDRLAGIVAGPAYRFGRAFCGNREDAEDVLQETMLALMGSIGRIRGESSLSTWAYVVARNACSRMRRRKRREVEPSRTSLESDEPDSGPPADERSDPLRSVEQAELAAALGPAIRALPPSLREALILRDVEDLPARQAARVAGVSERAFKSRLHRARRALRTTLAPWFEDRESADPAAGRAATRRGRASCPDTAQAFSRYLEGELSRSVCAELEQHVAQCLPCRHECDSLKTSLALCRTSGRERPPLRVRRAVREALSQVVQGSRGSNRRTEA